MMPNTQTFFKEYAKASLGGDTKKLAAFYSRNFVVVGPAGSMVFANDKNFLKWLKDVDAFNQKSGLEKMMVRKTRSRAVGKNGKQVTVTWGAVYKKTKNKVIEFDIHYILEKFGSDWKIVLFLSEEDQEQLMRENGVS